MAGPMQGGNKNHPRHPPEITHLPYFSLSLCPNDVEITIKMHMVFILKPLLAVTNDNFKFSVSRLIFLFDELLSLLPD